MKNAKLVDDKSFYVIAGLHLNERNFVIYNGEYDKVSTIIKWTWEGEEVINIKNIRLKPLAVYFIQDFIKMTVSEDSQELGSIKDILIDEKSFINNLVKPYEISYLNFIETKYNLNVIYPFFSREIREKYFTPLSGNIEIKENKKVIHHIEYRGAITELEALITLFYDNKVDLNYIDQQFDVEVYTTTTSVKQIKTTKKSSELRLANTIAKNFQNLGRVCPYLRSYMNDIITLEYKE